MILHSGWLSLPLTAPSRSCHIPLLGTLLLLLVCALPVSATADETCGWATVQK